MTGEEVGGLAGGEELAGVPRPLARLGDTALIINRE